MTTSVSPSLRALLTNIVDYAGLFPPAALEMREAVRNYADYRADNDRWMLGRFVVPIARLTEFAREQSALGEAAAGGEAWPLSVLGGPDATTDAAALDAFTRSGAAALVRVEAVEIRVQLPSDIANAVGAYRAVVSDAEIYVEFPLAEEPAPFIAALGAVGARAKARSGGVTPGAIPRAAQLLRFLTTCIRAGVPCKATAGLHHPLRADFSLTYEAGSARAEMHGYLNVFLAAAVLRSGGSARHAEGVMLERDPRSIVISPTAIRWREHTFDVRTLEETRALVAGFGSCSFREPVDDLRALALL